MINIDFLQYLIEYAKTQNLTKASRSLHLSQSSLTRAMQKIEDYVGVPIFTKSKNKLTLTDTGLELVKNAKTVLETVNTMRERTIAYYNSKTTISIGTVAPGPMIKYGNLLFSVFKGKSITSKIDNLENLIQKLNNDTYDVIFTNVPIISSEISSQFIFQENLFISIPKSHFLAGMTKGVHFKEIDGQSFLVANNLGIWDKIVAKELPKSRLFPQSMENLSEIVNSSIIPSFITNITKDLRASFDRVNIRILDEDASVNFYICYKTKNKSKLKDLLRTIF